MGSSGGPDEGRGRSEARAIDRASRAETSARAECGREWKGKKGGLGEVREGGEQGRREGEERGGRGGGEETDGEWNAPEYFPTNTHYLYQHV